MYQQTDRFRKNLKKRIRKEFNYWFVLAFDELNAVKVKKELTGLYDRLLDYNKSEFQKIAGEARMFALQYLTDEEKRRLRGKEKSLDDYIEFVLTSYNYTTTYLYYPETDRKRLRLGEIMLTSREYHDHKMYNTGVKKAADLWYTQSYQYAIDIEDTVVVETFKAAGIHEVIWNAEQDERTCHVCHDMDGNIYDIDEVPNKPHYFCRCWLEPYRGED